MPLLPPTHLRRSKRLKSKGIIEDASLHYQTLVDRQIRVLHLAPGQVGDPLVGELPIESLEDDNLEYDALSYMWGDPTPVAEIGFQSQILPIASNLNAALQSLRYPDKTLVIWIDAVCIDQSNLEERAQQVSLMRQVYSRARVVRSFINESVDTTCQAFEALQGFERVDDIEQRFGLGSDPTFYDPVAPIFSNAYWSRVWVQQEVLFAKEWIIHCGDTILNRTNVTEFHRADNLLFVTYAYSDPTKINLWLEHTNKHLGQARDLILRKHDDNWTQPLYRILTTTCTLETTHPCDKVYACMHLAKDYKEGGIEVDYRKTHLEVLIDAAEYHIRHHKNATLLIQAWTDSGTARSGIPSWLPMSWVSQQNFTPIESHRNSRALWGQRQLDMRIDMGSLRLHVRGIKIDAVHRCLTSDLDIKNLTARGFWNSQLGKLFLSQGSARDMTEILFNLISDVPSLETTSRDSTTRVVITLESMLDKVPDLPFQVDSRLNLLAIEEFKPEDRSTCLSIILSLAQYHVVWLNSGMLAMMNKECYEVGGELWIVLGCDHCIMLCPESTGQYRHLCSAIVPGWEQFEGFGNFTELSRTGDMIEGFLVEDVEIR